MPTESRIIRFIMWAAMAVLMGLWFHVYSQAYTAADTLWLADAAGRLLNGERMSDSYYDPNPPLSIILYTIPALISKIGLLPIHMAVFYYTIAILAFMAFLLARIIKAVPQSDNQTLFLCVAAFIIANTTLTAITFTERDQILGMALCPFVLTQVFITKKWELPRWLRHTSLLCGAIFVLLKPHHGLLPTLILLHRAISQKRIDLWKDADFIYLACGVLAYAVLCLTYFKDYTFTILPDVLALYSQTASPAIVKYYAHYVLIFAAVMVFGFFWNGRKISWPATFFLASAIIAFIPYVLQMRGYHYHMLPAVIFFTLGLTFTIRDIFKRFLSAYRAALATLITIIALALNHYPLMFKFPTHEQYKNFPISKIVEHCPDPCSFFMMNNTMEIAHQTAAYTGRQWASRFPSIWFMPAIMQLMAQGKLEEAAALRAKYGEMVGEDFARYQPKLVLLAEFSVGSRGRKLNFAKFFSESERFKEEWSKYRFVDRVTIDQGVYFKGTAQDRTRHMTYQIYERMEDATP